MTKREQPRFVAKYRWPDGIETETPARTQKQIDDEFPILEGMGVKRVGVRPACPDDD